MERPQTDETLKHKVLPLKGGLLYSLFITNTHNKTTKHDKEGNTHCSCTVQQVRSILTYRKVLSKNE